MKKLIKEKHLLPATKLTQMLTKNRAGKPLLTLDYTRKH